MKTVTLALGPAIDLASRHVVIRRVRNSQDQLTPVAAYYDQVLSGSSTSVAVSLPDDTCWECSLEDTAVFGLESVTTCIGFCTGNTLFPGPQSLDRLGVYSMV